MVWLTEMVSKKKTTDIHPIRARKLVCKNTRFEVFLDDIESSDGTVVHDYLAIVPRVRTVNGVAGIAVLPIIDNKIGLLRIFRYPLAAYSWEIPRGFVDPGEIDAVSALRELDEETGLHCNKDDLLSYGLIAPEPGLLVGYTHLYAALNCIRKRPYRTNEIGHEEFRLLEPAELSSMIASSEIREPCTLIACLKYLNPSC